LIFIFLKKIQKKKKFGGLIGDKLQRAKKLLKQVARLGGEEEGEPDESIDWWTKYFSSVGEGQTGPEVIIIIIIIIIIIYLNSISIIFFF